MAYERSNARPSTETAPPSPHRTQFPHATCLIVPPFVRLHARGSNATPSSVKNQSGFTRQAACNRSTRTAGARGGGCAASPRCDRMRWITAGSSMAAMSLSCPPQCGHCSMSTSNTRFNNCAQRMRPFALTAGGWAGVWAQSPACTAAVADAAPARPAAGCA